MYQKTSIFVKAYRFLIDIGNGFRSILLLIIRLYWGWQFFITGYGKLNNIQNVIDFFISLNIPWPIFNAYVVGFTECIGGLLLLVGLGSRLAAIPLSISMSVAYLTAHRTGLSGFFSNPEDFFNQAPFLFLYASLLIFACGPGGFSIDYILQKLFFSKNEKRQEMR